MARNSSTYSNNSSPTVSSNGDISENKDHGGEKAKQINDNDLTPNAETQQDAEIELTKAEMSEVMEENQRLKQYLDKIMKDYQALQKKFYENSKKSNDTKAHRNPSHARRTNEEDDAEELVSLSLGRTLSVDSKKSIDKLCINITNSSRKEKDETISESTSNNNIEEMREKSLDLGLNCNFDVPKITCVDQGQNLMPSSSSEGKDREISNGISKNNGSRIDGDDEVVQQPPVKKARVSVRARCDTPTMNDGCQWRKYGQKIAKGNPCPRAYYRCTVAPSCPVRKQVQRCAEDMSILITTYEGTHNHPLPMSATSIASTTSAAAFMLTSGSSSSSTTPNQGLHSHHYTPTTPSFGTDLVNNGAFNFNGTLNNNNTYSSLSSSLSRSQLNTHPTITLDLTNNINSASTLQCFVPRPNYSSTTLNFGSLDYTNSSISNTWPSQKHLTRHQTIFPNSNNNDLSINNYVPDTITQAAAKVLTSDPSFQSVITAALSSFITNGNINGNNNGVVESSSHNHNNKWGVIGNNSTLQSTTKGNNNACQTSASLTLLSSSLSSLYESKSPSTSPNNDKDRVS